MTKEQQQILATALATLREIEPDAVQMFRAKFQMLAGFWDSTDTNQFFAAVVAVDGSGWAWHGWWKTRARLWMLVTLLNGPAGTWFPPTVQERTPLLQTVSSLSSSVIDDAIRNLLYHQATTHTYITALRTTIQDVSRDAWDPANFTDPTHHNLMGYRYLIHAMRPTTLDVSDHQQITHLRKHYPSSVIRHPTNQNQVRFRVTQCYLEQPSVLCSEVLSCSVINHLKHATYQNMCFGFILRVPKHNICDAGARDLVAASVQNTGRGLTLVGRNRLEVSGILDDFWSQIAGKAKSNIPSPTAVLHATSTHGHNELIVLGTFLQRVVPVGLFVKVTSQGKLWRDFMTTQDYDLPTLLYACSQTFNIPIVPIVDNTGAASTTTFADWRRTGHRPLTMTRELRPSSQEVVLRRSTSTRALGVVPSRLMSPEVRKRYGDNLTFAAARFHLAQFLNIQPQTPLDQLHRLYRKYAKIHHPDKGGDGVKFEVVKGLLDIVEGEDDTGQHDTGSIEGPKAPLLLTYHTKK